MTGVQTCALPIYIEDNPLSPQKIFSLSSEKVESLLSMSQVIDFFDIDFREKKNYIALKNNLEPKNILRGDLDEI